MDGVSLSLLTADRPYENRDTGANQAFDQVNVYSQSYIRWFRDTCHPVTTSMSLLLWLMQLTELRLSKSLMGLVHFNIQFRENLAPDAGPIRNDDRSGSTS
jgi:2-succinyl-5-enolpyruvyl-6-hydroxy-3-cyclohexene-1-carboxylate synthase